LNTEFYRDFGDLLRETFPFKVQKISINSGFTCPNRDGTRGWGGCTYCDNRAFSPQYTAGKSDSVTAQLEEGVRFFSHKYPKMKYLAYFQSYTSSYGSTSAVIKNCREALEHPDVVGLILGTRPDCLPPDLLDALAELCRNRFLLIECGIESTSDETLRRINRGHTYAEAVAAIANIHERGIKAGAHLILGLPGESRETILSHADRLSQLPLTTVKLHQLQLLRGTPMASEYTSDPSQFHLFESVEEYIDLCIAFLRRLNPSFYIDRFISQSPKALRLLPGWNIKNHEFTKKLQQRLKNLRETEKT
jgi:radical SAM protein (TIGR01212 family)